MKSNKFPIHFLFKIIGLGIVMIFTLRASAQQLDGFKGLTGKWQRNIPNSKKVSYEEWELNDRVLHGHGFVIEKQDTVFQEQLKIFEENGNIYYSAFVPENEGETRFELSGISNGVYRFENPSHDFPTYIQYKWNEKKLFATVGNDRTSVDFEFTRIE